MRFVTVQTCRFAYFPHAFIDELHLISEIEAPLKYFYSEAIVRALFNALPLRIRHGPTSEESVHRRDDGVDWCYVLFWKGIPNVPREQICPYGSWAKGVCPDTIFVKGPANRA